MPNNPLFCTRCADLDAQASLFKIFSGRMAEIEPSKIVLSFGTIESLRPAQDCPCCQSIDAALHLFPKQPNADIAIEISWLSKCPTTLHGWNETCADCLTIQLVINCTREAHGASRNLLPINPSTGIAEKLWKGPWGRQYNPRDIDLDLIKHWLRSCDEEHFDVCAVDPSLSMTNLPIYLLDTEQNCLVSARLQGTSYVALSYVWGQAPTLKTTLKRLEGFKKRGSLRSRDAEIPRTIRDAMRLVKNLGLRFLWVDCFCIVQDDEASLEENLVNMGSIYANSYFTIVAAKGIDASRGLRGVGRQSKPRRSLCPIIHLPSIQLQISPRTSNIDKIKRSPWAQRCWTFQEAFYARRVLVFDDEITWYCPTVTFKESVIDPERNPACLDPDLEEDVKMGLVIQYEIPRSLPYVCVRVHERHWAEKEDEYDRNWREYHPIIKEFNRRSLTSDEDVTRAFAGVVQIIGKHTRQSFFFGFPLLIFDLAMLWQPLSPDPRRRFTRMASDQKAKIPSWSWMGWQCDIDLDSWRTMSNYQSTTTLIEWHSELMCPWKQPNVYHMPNVVTSHNSVCLCRGIAAARQWDSDGHAIEDSSLLYFKSERVWLYADSARTGASGVPQIVHLYGSNDVHVGYMILLCETKVQHDSTLTPENLRTLKLELILISEGYVSRDARCTPEYYQFLDKDICNHLEYSNSEYEYYNALCITWENGIAYRVGLGRLEKQALLEQSREAIDVILG